MAQKQLAEQQQSKPVEITLTPEELAQALAGCHGCENLKDHITIPSGNGNGVDVSIRCRLVGRESVPMYIIPNPITVPSRQCRRKLAPRKH